ncbi:MAG: hypothetical protein ABFR90_06670, partial [Planctomycetota bacterium]
MARRKYKPYATRNQQKSRRMRNVALALIVLIIAIVIFNKTYSGKESTPEQANAQTTPLNDVLPSAAPETPTDSGPLVVPTPGTASAKAAPEPEPEPEPPITFVPQEPAVTAQPEIIKETVAVE